MSYLDSVLTFENRKERSPFEICARPAAELRRREIARFQRKGLPCANPQPLEFQKAAVGRKRKPGRDLLLILHHPQVYDSRRGAHAPPRKLFAETHQLVEVNFGRSDERAGAALALHHALALKRHERMPRGHEAHAVCLGEKTFRFDRIARFQLARFYSFLDRALDSEVGGNATPRCLVHNVPGQAWARISIPQASNISLSAI